MQDVRTGGLLISASSVQIEDNSDGRTLLAALSVHCPLRGEESTLMDNFPSLFGIHPPQSTR